MKRGLGASHVVEFLCRRGGTTVYLNRSYPDGLTESQVRGLIRHDAQARKLKWRVITRDPEAYARGYVRHLDHRTMLYWVLFVGFV